MKQGNSIEKNNSHIEIKYNSVIENESQTNLQKSAQICNEEGSQQESRKKFKLVVQNHQQNLDKIMSESKQIFEINKRMIINQIHRMKQQDTVEKISRIVSHEKKRGSLVKGGSLTDLKSPKRILTRNQAQTPLQKKQVQSMKIQTDVNKEIQLKQYKQMNSLEKYDYMIIQYQKRLISLLNDLKRLNQNDNKTLNQLKVISILNSRCCSSKSQFSKEQFQCSLWRME